MWCIWKTGEARTGRHLRKGRQLEELGRDGRIIFKWIFKKGDGEAWTALLWLRIGTGGGLLWNL
jgi:hypothetical protein